MDPADAPAYDIPMQSRYFIVEYKPGNVAYVTPHTDASDKMFVIDPDTGEMADEFPRPAGLDELATLRKRYRRSRGFTPGIAEAAMRPGEYHPRMYRPGMPLHRTIAWEAWASSTEAARALFDGMRRVFRVVEPTRANQDTYGHEIRQLLILACTEVESAWKAVLRANGYAPTAKGKARTEQSWKTYDYVKLLAPMRLADWEVEFYSHFDHWRIRPFGNWDASKASESLPWYRAYNAAKHNRELKFSDATLRHMITSMAAVFVMVKAQFGTFSFDGDRSEREEFRVVKQPKWPVEQWYLPHTIEAGAPLRAVPWQF